MILKFNKAWLALAFLQQAEVVDFPVSFTDEGGAVDVQASSTQIAEAFARAVSVRGFSAEDYEYRGNGVYHFVFKTYGLLNFADNLERELGTTLPLAHKIELGANEKALVSTKTDDYKDALDYRLREQTVEDYSSGSENCYLLRLFNQEEFAGSLNILTNVVVGHTLITIEAELPLAIKLMDNVL